VFCYLEELESKKEGLIGERALEKYSHDQINRLIVSEKNQLLNILGGSVD